MKKNYLLLVAFVVTTFTFGQTIFINEIHYDNAGGDVNEGVEIAGPEGSDLTGWKVIHYNGNGGTIISTTTLSGVILDQLNGFGTKWFPIGLQNDTEALALVNQASIVVQFISYEGVLTANEGAAVGMISVEIGVSQNADPVGTSIQLTNTGWIAGMLATPNSPNTGQTLSLKKNQIEGFSMYPNPVANGKFSIASKSKTNKQVEIYSLLGKQVYSKNVKVNQLIEVFNLNRGIYILRVEEEGKIAKRK